MYNSPKSKCKPQTTADKKYNDLINVEALLDCIRAYPLNIKNDVAVILCINP